MGMQNSISQLEVVNSSIENKDANLDINVVYENYMNLFRYLDNLRFNVLAAMFVVFGGVVTVINLCCKDSFSLLVIGLSSIIVSISIKYYNNLIFRFTKGSDHVCLLLADIEKRNQHIFRNQIKSPYEKDSYATFFIRRSAYIQKNEMPNKLSEFSQLRLSLQARIIGKIISLALMIAGIISVIVYANYNILLLIFGITIVIVYSCLIYSDS